MKNSLSRDDRGERMSKLRTWWINPEARDGGKRSDYIGDTDDPENLQYLTNKWSTVQVVAYMDYEELEEENKILKEELTKYRSEK